MIEIYEHDAARLRPFSAFLILPEGMNVADSLVQLV